jgi:hypothetical protein
MKKEDFIDHVQTQVAELAIGASSLRNQGGSGLIASSRAFFKGIDLSVLAHLSSDGFKRFLDKATDDLKNKFPEGARNWGAARKAINLFLRDAFYNRYLFDHYKLAPIEQFLEVPLDKDVATNLMDTEHGKSLPEWVSIKTLAPDVSCQYQEVASKFANDNGLARVHLDLLFWRKETK